MKARDGVTKKAIHRDPAPYPFTAIVGQDEMKLGLILSVIDPHIEGVLIMGHRGTGKSTAVRALADLLPPLKRVRGCAYGCDPRGADGSCESCAVATRRGRPLPGEERRVPVVELPLGATEDRVCGSLDIEKALNAGIKAFEPGLLARAHRGFLYIDEVNLLEDHLVDLLLDVAASGRNVVEREGISLSHPARFVLVGSGNPEEGEVRPQLLDRFGFYVCVETVNELDARVEIMRRRERFERDPEVFRNEAGAEQARLRRRIVCARRLLPQVDADSELIARIAGVCLQLNIVGHRGELTILRAAKALAAFEGRKRATDGDVRRVAVMSLRHRLRRDLHGEMDFGVRIQHALEEVFTKGSAASGGGSQDHEDRVLAAVDAIVPADVYDAALAERDGKRTYRPGRGREDSRKTDSSGAARSAREARGTPAAKSVALGATVRAAAPLQRLRQTAGADCRIRIYPEDLRFKRSKRDERLLIIFVVDASGSMVYNRIREAKGAVQRLLRQAYCRRDKVAIITFRAGGAQLLLPPSRSVERASCAMDNLAAGGGTPLAAGIHAALDLAHRTRSTEQRESLLVLLTDGCANLTLAGKAAAGSETVWHEIEHAGAAVRAGAIASVVIDTRQPLLARGEGKRLASLLGARHVSLRRLDAEEISGRVTDVIRTVREGSG
jgi:magnesium chelatase subunit D